MDKSEEEYLLELWERNVCPNCGASIAKGTRVGSGQKAKGGFCSLDCYARFYEVEIIQRTHRLAELSRRNQDSYHQLLQRWQIRFKPVSSVVPLSILVFYFIRHGNLRAVEICGITLGRESGELAFPSRFRANMTLQCSPAKIPSMHLILCQKRL
jgi:hypothetical protein